MIARIAPIHVLQYMRDDDDDFHGRQAQQRRIECHAAVLRVADGVTKLEQWSGRRLDATKA